MIHVSKGKTKNKHQHELKSNDRGLGALRGKGGNLNAPFRILQQEERDKILETILKQGAEESVQW